MCLQAFGVFYALKTERQPQAPEQEQSGAENILVELSANSRQQSARSVPKGKDELKAEG
jgi:hypothetical protein